ncbi:SRPBCC family protein [Mycolicibacterium brisbanense]
MTVTLRHAIKIAAPRHKVFTALADTAEMAAWHVGGVDGAVAIGETFRLNPKPGLNFAWRTVEITPDEAVRQECVAGPGNSAGKTLTFTLSDTDEGGTRVDLSDGQWPADDPGLPFCNTRWAEVLLRLKQYVETGA